MAEPIGVCIIVCRDNSILLGQRINAYGAGLFGLPGGRIEGSESIERALARELEEETSLKGKAFQYLGVIREWQPKNQASFIHFAFSCSDFEGEPRLCEPGKCAGWQWYDLLSLPQDILPGHLTALNLVSNSSITLRDIGYHES